MNVESDMPSIDRNGNRYGYLGKTKVSNYIFNDYPELKPYVYEIEYKYIYASCSFFFGQSKEENEELVMCSCMKKSIENFIEIQKILGPFTPNFLGSTPLHQSFFPRKIAINSAKNHRDPIKTITFIDKICPRCKGIVIGPKSNIFQKYVDQYLLKLGISFFHWSYLECCPEDLKLLIDYYREELNKINTKLIVPGRGTKEMYDLLDENEKQKMYNLMKDQYNFRKTFENDIRISMGFKKIGEGLVSETQLFKILDKIFNRYKIYKHYRPPFLKGLEIDYYISDLKLGIEYQGKQHFEPIKLFGGEEKFKNQLSRDQLKKEYCIQNGIELVYINYFDILSELEIKNKLCKYIIE